jgi:transcriptional regulator
MYTRKLFEETDREEIGSVMRDYPFAMVITQGGGAPTVSHLPVLYEPGDGHGRIVGHLARANSQWKHFADGQRTLVVFQGPHRYVSPRWYRSPVNVPTWNYVAVHAQGPSRIIEERSQVHAILERTVARFEAGSERPWRFDVPTEFLEERYPRILGFEVVIDTIEAKFKLNQNRPDEDRRAVIERLAEQDDSPSREMYTLMKRMDTRKDPATPGG